MSFFRTNLKGSVCITLTLLMLPLYSFALACTDAVKITSAERMASKAGELGLDAGMSDYNTVLKNTYGLYAVSDIDASSEDLAESFLKSLPVKSQTECYNNTISFEEENISAEYPEYAVIANPDILKYQITEYNKYEETVSSLGMFLSKFGDEKEFTDIESRDDDTVDNKNVSDISEEDSLNFFQKISEQKADFFTNDEYSDSDKSEVIKEQTKIIEEMFGKTEKSNLFEFMNDDMDDEIDRKNMFEKYFYDSLSKTKDMFSFKDAESLKDDFLITEYILDHFSFITDDNVHRENGKINFSANNNFLFGKEAEYILFGNDNPGINTEVMEKSIYSVRFVFNCIYVFNDSTIRSAAKTAAAAASLATRVPETVYEYLFLFSYAAAESESDVKKLVRGEKVSLYKSKSSMSIKIPSVSSEKEESMSFSIEMDYRDYMELFLIISLQGEKKERDILIRTAAIIGTNMKYALSDYKTDNGYNFDITKAYTVIELNAELKTDTMLLGLFDNNGQGKKKIILVKKRKVF